MSIISDRHESIASGIKVIYPEAEHMFCIFHILNNVKIKFKKNTAQIREFFFAAAKSYTLYEFNSNMIKIKKLDQRLHQYLEDIGYENWTKVHSANNRYRIMTTNIAESINGIIKFVRELPIITLLEYLHGLVQEWSSTSRNIVRATFTTLADRKSTRLNSSHSGESRMPSSA